MTSSLLPYILVILIIGSLSFLEAFSKNKAFVRFSLFGVLFFLTASLSRGDYSSYIYAFRNINITEYSPVFEPFFYGMMYLIKLSNLNENFVFIFSGIIAILIKFKALGRLNINYSFFFLIYVSLFFVYLELGSIRFAISIAFLLLAITYLPHNAKKYNILILLGAFFHTSLALAFIIPLIKKRNPILILIISVIIGSISISLINNSYIVAMLQSNYYLSKFYNYTRFGTINFSFQFLKELVITIGFYILYAKEIKLKYNFIHLLWFLSIFKISIYLLFASNQLVASRYLLMFSIIDPIIIILMFQKLRYTSKIAFGAPLLTICLLVIFCYTIIVNDNIINLYLPYKNYFLGDLQIYEDPFKLKQIVEQNFETKN